MRIGICLNMLATQPGDTGIDFIEKAAAAGFDYAEMPLAETMALSEKEFEALLARVERSGIRCESCNNFFPRTLRLTGPEADMDAIGEYIRAALGRAARLGAKVVVFGSGPAKSAPDGFPLAVAYRQVVEITRLAADAAAGLGITIVIEPLRAQECNLINTYREGVALAREAERENVRALVDYYHLSEMEEPAAHVVDGGAMLGHAHFARHAGRVFPKDIGEEPGYRAFADALDVIGYQERVSLEAYSQDFEKDAPVALRVMRELFT